MYDQLRAKMLAYLRPLDAPLAQHIDAADRFYMRLRNVTVDDFLHHAESAGLDLPSTLRPVPKKIGGRLRPSPVTCIADELDAAWWGKWLAYTFSAPSVQDAVSVLYTAAYDAALTRVLSTTFRQWDSSRRSICQAASPVDQLATFITNPLSGSADVLVINNPPDLHTSRSFYTTLEKHEAIAGRFQVIPPHCGGCTAPLVLVDVNVVEGAFRVLHQASDKSTLIIGTMANHAQTGVVLHFTSADFVYLEKGQSDRMRISVADADNVVPLPEAKSLPQLCGMIAQKIAVGHPNRRHVSTYAPFDLVAYQHDFTMDVSARTPPQHATLPREVLPNRRGATTSDAVRRTMTLVHHVLDGERRARAAEELPVMDTPPRPDADASLAPTRAPLYRCARGGAVTVAPEKKSRVCEAEGGGVLLQHANGANAAHRWDTALVAAGMTVNGAFLPFTKYSQLRGDDDDEGAPRAALTAASADPRYGAEYTVVLEARNGAVGTRETPVFRCEVNVFYPRPQDVAAEVQASGEEVLVSLPAGNTELKQVEVAFRFDPHPANPDGKAFEHHGAPSDYVAFAPRMAPGRATSEDAYKSAVAYGVARGAAFALLPDLEDIASRQVAGTWNGPSMLSLHTPGASSDDLPMAASVGIAAVAGRVLHVPPPHRGTPLFTCDVLATSHAEPHAFATTINHFLWTKYGHPHLRKTLSQLAAGPAPPLGMRTGVGGLQSHR
eukprot:TRINITY_DN16093_c0_g1_i3.p1 TRINITY_DN16093_c0_g1~~TRINITY_DN16093_c0_g1_i3.p1  ORF type:complete len:722 (+),score=163.96 TRINITY_DN16093_c0_g1_i3:485-2650(+)